MCGIAGVFRPGEVTDDLDLVRGMLEVLQSRGPDGKGVFNEGGLTLGHRRLAVLDLSEAARQPMESAGGRLVVSFNGEIYNYRELIRELGVPRDSLRSSSDTEVLLLAWERWGPAALDRLVGQWAFALYDRKERRLWLARDRFGEKPLFYHQGAGALTFASSIPALLKAPWIPREIDADALGEYLTLRYVVSPRTILREIRKLPPGHLLSADPGGVTIRRWYDPRFSPKAPGPGARAMDDLVEEFGSLLVQAANRCLVSDVPVGLLLSDGIDSNSIHAALAMAGHHVPCLTYRPVSVVDDPPSRVPAPTGRGVKIEDDYTYEILVTTDERLRHLVPAFSCLTEPVGDGAALPTWLLMRSGRPGITVFLSGSGGDEVLAGYRLDQDRLRLAAIHRFSWLPEILLRGVLERHTNGADSAAARRAALRRAPASLVPAVSRYLIHRPLPPDDLARLFQPMHAPGRYLEAVDRAYADCAEDATDLDRIQEVMLRTFLSENILSFSDSAAMGSSAELRMPFLDRDLVEFALHLPGPMRARLRPGFSGTKRILYQWSRRHLRDKRVARRKHTFRYGSVRHLLARRGDEVRGLVLGSRALRRALPGLEGWVGNAPEFFRGPREGTLWALLALGIWAESWGIL